MPRIPVRLFAAVALLACTAIARAQDSSSAPAQTAPPTCDASEHRQFDFWIGEWTVRGPSGAVVGTNRIESILAGCAIAEHWTSSGGNHGTSLNFYDRTARRWMQTWIDNAGQPLFLSGTFREGRMVLEGTTPGADGAAPSLQRITWSRIGNDGVRQLWETSADGGKTWVIAFDGKYTRQSSR